MTQTRVRVDGTTLAATTEGSGEPLLVVQTALAVDELVPFMREPALRDRFRVITFDRRGYGASGAGPDPGSIASDARDCLAVLGALDAAPAHVVGVSYAAAVALVLAADAPTAVRTLTVVEPPPRHVAAGPEFVATSTRLLDTYRREGVAAALEAVMTLLVGPGWRPRQERLAPGSVARLERDADAFFSRDIPALLAWEFGAAEAARVTAPVLSVGGAGSGPWFDQTPAWVASLFPGARSVSIPGAGHDLALTHPGELAAAFRQFVDDRAGRPAG